MAIMLPLPYFSSTQAVSVWKAQEIIGFLSFYPFRIHTVWHGFFVTMYNYHPLRLAKSNIPKQYFSHGVNDVSDGSPSRIRRVRRISFGMTILPRSSTRRTMPVAFIVYPLLVLHFQWDCLQEKGDYAICAFGICFRKEFRAFSAASTCRKQWWNMTSKKPKTKTHEKLKIMVHFLLILCYARDAKL